MRQDVIRVLDAWQRHVPADRIHLVTVPPPGAGSGLLLERFSDALGLPAGTLASASGPMNISLGPVEIEVIRRLNARVTEKLDQRQYLHLVEHGIRQRMTAPASRPLVLPEGHYPWVAERSRDIIDGLASRGHVVHGDLEELLPVPPDPAAVAVGRGIDDVTDGELVIAYEDMFAGLALAHGALFRRHRNLLRQAGESPGVLEGMASRRRAAVFGAKTRALRWADRSPVVAWGARQYLRATSKGGPRH